jgi:hypothetical protein
MFWIDLRGGILLSDTSTEISATLIGPGPCESPIIGLAT